MALGHKCMNVNATVDPHSRKINIYLNVYFLFALVSRQSAELTFATQHAMTPELSGKCRIECLNISARQREPTGRVM